MRIIFSLKKRSKNQIAGEEKCKHKMQNEMGSEGFKDLPFHQKNSKKVHAFL